MYKSIGKKGLSLILSLMMLFSLIPTFTASAITGDGFLNTTTNENYSDLTTALSEAKSGETVKLFSDFDGKASGAVMVNAGVTLDLNGKIIEALNFLSYGDVVDTAGNGGIKISDDTAQAFTLFAKNNTYMPVYDVDDGCYRVFEYDIVNKGAKTTDSADKIKFNFAVIFANETAYELLAANPATLTMTVDIEIAGQGTLDQEFKYTCDAAVLKVYSESVLEADADSVSLTFTVSGIERLIEGASISAKPTITSVATNVTKTATTETYKK